MESDKPRYVIGIEGSANKVGIGIHQEMKESSIFKGISFQTQEKLLSLLRALDFCRDKQPTTMPNKFCLLFGKL
jgi:hypothetical protein